MQTADAAETLTDGALAGAPATGSSLESLACFEVAGRLFALDVAHVREIVRMQEITPLPMSPDLIEGVAELRDGVVPVIDLGRALSGERCRIGSESRIAVLEYDDLVVGLVVERATDVLSVDASSLEDPPALATQAGYEAVRAVVRQEGAKPVLVLSVEYILESVYRSVLRSERGSQ
jgi:purine-binding chemotaxis protein CheW